jgi:hypothetical protein
MQAVFDGSRILAAAAAVVLLGWTPGNEASRFAQADAALVAEGAVCPVVEQCPSPGDGMLAHWVGRTGDGNLFVLVRSNCRGAPDCGAWFVERSARGVTPRLSVDGRFQVVRGNKPVPDVQTWRSVSDSQYELTRYTWTAGAYVRAETRQIFHVDGQECGTALDCYHKARAAHAGHRTGEALRILEKVHNLSFI